MSCAHFEAVRPRRCAWQGAPLIGREQPITVHRRQRARQGPLGVDLGPHEPTAVRGVQDLMRRLVQFRVLGHVPTHTVPTKGIGTSHALRAPPWAFTVHHPHHVSAHALSSPRGIGILAPAPRCDQRTGAGDARVGGGGLSPGCRAVELSRLRRGTVEALSRPCLSSLSSYCRVSVEPVDPDSMCLGVEFCRGLSRSVDSSCRAVEQCRADE